jgi:hypothetical protein
MEISRVRKRLQRAIALARADAAARRARSDRAESSYARFLETIATPVFRQFANALQAEGYPFRVFTPASGLRLSSERSPGDGIELALEPATDPALVMVRVTRGRGSRISTTEVPLREGCAIDELTEEDVLDALARAIPPFVER